MKMNCPKCNAELDEDMVFCGSCGYDLSADNIMNTLDKDGEDAPKSKGSKKKSKKKTDSQPSEKKPIRWKLILIIFAVVVLLVGALYIAMLFNSGEGEKLLDDIPIGRDIAYAESRMDREFLTQSKYDAMKSINDFDNICESNTGLKIEGISLPEWAVVVSTAEDKTIDRVIYYDFSQLQKSWKGQHSSEEIATTAVTYGMSERAVEKALGFKPYTIIKGIDNTTTYVYRYHYTDDATGNDIVCNYSVVFNDIDGNVKSISSDKIDYSSFMLSVN